MVERPADIDRTDTPPGGPEVAEITRTDGQIVHPGIRYERTDVDYWLVLLVFVLAACIGSFLLLSVWWFFNDFSHRESAIKRSPFPLAPAPAADLPREPRLEQLDRMAGIERPNVYRRELAKEEILESLGPANEAGYVHVPIDRAMKAVVGKVSTAKQARPQAYKSNGLLDAGEPNSGRLFREGPP
jgi:hypothetical protein